MRVVLRNWLPPVLVFICFVAAWDLLVRAFSVPPFLVPAPRLVFAEMVAHRNELWQATVSTGTIALLGFALSLTVGTLLALAMAQSRIIERSFYPYAIFLQTVPIVAIAPIIIIWCGPGTISIVVISFIISLFPVITNTTHGLTHPPRQWLELMQVYQAGWWAVLCKVRIPAAVPYIITGAKISAGLSVVGAIVGEYFTSMMDRDYGIAYLVVMNAENARTAYLFATTLMSALLGLVIFSVVSLLGSLVLRHGHFRETAE
jgi:NitT/TauT family transport system permease protein